MSGTGEKASAALVKRLIRRRIKRHPEHDHAGLNIYPMLDMMTILLVFMVMQFASSTASAIGQGSELTIPYSTSRVDLGEALAVQISRSAISVDGNEVCPLRNGLVDPSIKQGGGVGFLIMPLNSQMERIAEERRNFAAAHPSRPFTGEVQIVADHRTPFRTLSEVIYTLGQSGFANLRFVAAKANELGQMPQTPQAR